MIADHDLALEIFKEATTDKPSSLYWTYDVITGSSSIVTSPNNAYWKFIRRATAHAFSKSEISQMVQIATTRVETWMTSRLDEMIVKDISFDPL